MGIKDMITRVKDKITGEKHMTTAILAADRVIGFDPAPGRDTTAYGAPPERKEPSGEKKVDPWEETRKQLEAFCADHGLTLDQLPGIIRKMDRRQVEKLKESNNHRRMHGKAMIRRRRKGKKE